jgi:hypothetical protein
VKQTFLSKTILGQATPVLGAVALSAIALVGMPQSAKAGVECGLPDDSKVAGADWVSKCPEGSDHFSDSWAFIDLWLDVPLLENILQQDIFPDTFTGHLVGDDALMFSGPVWIDRKAGNNGIIETVLKHTLTGTNKFLGNLILDAQGTGEISDNGNGMADSFFDVDFTINAGGLSFAGETRVSADRLLKGVSPDMLDNGPATKKLCRHDDPKAAVQYCGKGYLWLLDPNGNVVKDTNGNPIKVGSLKETHIVHPRVPEPSTAAASIFVGLGAMFGLKRRQQSNK